MRQLKAGKAVPVLLISSQPLKKPNLQYRPAVGMTTLTKDRLGAFAHRPLRRECLNCRVKYRNTNRRKIHAAITRRSKSP